MFRGSDKFSADKHVNSARRFYIFRRTIPSDPHPLINTLQVRPCFHGNRSLGLFILERCFPCYSAVIKRRRSGGRKGNAAASWVFLTSGATSSAYQPPLIIVLWPLAFNLLKLNVEKRAVSKRSFSVQFPNAYLNILLFFLFVMLG